MKTRTMKSILSLVLSLTLAMGLMTSTVFATDIEVSEPDPEATEEDISEDKEVPGIIEEGTESAQEQMDEAVPADEEDPEIQVFASTDEDQTLKVEQKADGDIGDDVSFIYHLYQIIEAAETIENMGDITESEPGAGLEYVIIDTETEEEISDGTTDEEGTFTLHVGETAQFTLEPETSWYVYQDTPEAYPLLSVGSDGEYAAVVDSTNGVVYYGQIEPGPEQEQPTVSVSVSTNIGGNEKTYDGEAVILTATAEYTPDTATVSYQWYKDDEEISGATGRTLTLDGSVSDSGTYKCVVTAANDELTATAEAEAAVTINKAAQNISYAITDIEKTLDDEPFTNVLTQTTVSRDDGAGITYASSDETVATVDAKTGEVTIVGAGEVTITATAAATENYEEANASYTITVTEQTEPEPEQPVISDLTVTSNLTDNEKTYDGETVTLTADVSYSPDTADVSYQWYKDDEEIDGANEENLTLDGNVSDSGTYKCVVTVTNDELTETDEAEVTVTINKAEQDISYAESTVTKIDYDEDFVIELTETTVDGHITYTSSDESVATVNPETGEVTIVGPGYTTITATAAGTDNYEEASASYVLFVNTDDVEWEIDVNNERVTWDEENEEWVDDLSYTGDPLELEMMITLTEEEEEELEGISYQWYRYDPVTQDFDEIEGATEYTYTLEGADVNAGDYIYMCMAVVTYTNGYEHTVYGPIEVIIEKAAQEISYEETEIEKTTVDGAFTNPLTETKVSTDEGAGITYTSSDESVATVDENGEVTIVGSGKATITATAAATENYEEATASYTITVLGQPAIYELTITSDLDGNEKDYDGKTVTLTADMEYVPDTAEVSYQWYQGNEEITGATDSTLTLDGDVSDSGTYKCVVTVTNDGLTTSEEAEITVSINKAEQDISYAESTVTMVDYEEDFTIELTKTVVNGQITYTSSDETVATVDSDTGVVHIVGTGYTRITATAAETDNYKEASASYVLFVNTDEIDWEIDVNHDQVTWDEEHEEWVDDLTYTGEPLELEMTVTLTDDEQEELEEISYQWYRFNSETQDFDEIEGATEEAYTLEGADVNAGDYIYMCMAVVTYTNGYEHTVYGPIEVIIEKAAQDISYEETEIEKTTADEPFTNPLTETKVSSDEGAGITYESSDETIATIDEDGLVTIVGIGEVTITATAAETTNYVETTASYTIVVTEFYNVKYAVVIYGINQDVDADGNILGLTFGPATGTHYINTYKAHLTEEQYDAGEGICLHWMSWEEIIEQSKEDPTVFQTCLENGCTHSVNLTLNDTLLATDYAGQMDNGDGAGFLYSSINSNYRMWNSSNYITGGWPASQVRAVLNGKDDQLGNYAEYALDASDCLFSCFPSVLQDSIVAKAVKSDTVHNSQTEANNKTTYDKLWLFSGKELYGGSGDCVRTYEGELYQRSEILGITTSNYGSLRNYHENGSGPNWWLRSLDTREYSWITYVYSVYWQGECYTINPAVDTGLAPGFCLAGPSVSQENYNVKYAVSIYGINQDVDADGYILGLTFGPATGASYISTYKAHLTEEQYDAGEGICLHWMSWEEIIEQSKEDPTVFQTCLENGCTHSVNITLNDTLLATSYSGQMDNGDGAGFLYNSISSNYRIWNSSLDNTGGWPASRVRATLNGTDSSTDSSVAGSDTLSESKSLFSCFPTVLQDAIVAKAVKSDTVYNSQTEENNKTTYDKLWLFSGKELYGSGSINDVIRTYEGELYQRSEAFGITTSKCSDLDNYNETGVDLFWWMRSLETSNSGYVYYVFVYGNSAYSNANNTNIGLAPGFCLAGPGVKKPAINGVTITSGLTDNVKTYDGNEVTLIVVADYVPDIATITYQWYKENDAGEYTEIEGEDEETLTLEGNVSDTGTYKCEVTITYGGFNTSDYAEITITINVAEQDISYEETEIEKTTADGAFTNPLTETFVDPNGQITYASSDETVATVNAETGEVTILSDGEVTITATAAATANCTKATASYMITISKSPVVNYAVKLWGICKDTYSYDEGETTSVASLTFGPATGADHLNSYVECSSDTCIHKLNWDEIIAYCNQYQGDSAMLTSLFGSCLENGCTKAVELTTKANLFNMTVVNNALAQGYTGDGVSTLFYLLNGTGSTSYTYGADWNPSYTGYSGSDPANIYSRSRIRATLTGDSADAKAWVEDGHNDYYGVDTLCDESNCLLSCFPAELQAAVVPRTTLNTGNAAAGTSAYDKTTYDKLFLFSLKETGISSRYDDGGGSDYGVNSNASDRFAYEFSGTAATTSSSSSWWLRSRSSADFRCANYFSPTTGGDVDSPVDGNYGLSPGFCIK